jgi:DNA-binding response OmpR family regulator
MKILVVEDDERLAALLRRGLSESGHVVDVEHEGCAAEALITSGAYDAVVLDVLLPGKDGFSVAAAARAAGVATPILMLTSRDTDEDAATGLDAGADDYLRKPFSFRELEARLRAIVRREREPRARELQAGDVVLDLAARRARRGERLLDLTAREFAFLEYFVRHAGLVVTRRMLEDALWERDRETSSNVIEVYVRRLRAKLSADGEPQILHTVRGAGYRFGSPP